MLHARHPGPVAAAITFVVGALVGLALGNLWLAALCLIFAGIAWLFSPDEQDPDRRRRIRDRHRGEDKYSGHAYPRIERQGGFGGGL